MKQYYRIMAGSGSVHAAQCFKDGFIGVDYGFTQDLTEHLPENWRDFNREFIPIFLANHPGKTRVAAGLACGMTWTVTKGLNVGDRVLCPTGDGRFRIGDITGPYEFRSEEVLPHRRPVNWHARIIQKEEMSNALRTSCSAGTGSYLSGYAEEIEKLLGEISAPTLIATDDTVQDPYAFAMEKHLEDFIVQNWAHTAFAKDYKIFENEDGKFGQQYDIGDGKIDILAVSKDQKTLLVIELKRGRASDVVVGQTLRYMGYVQEELAEEGQSVSGAIIALEDDSKLRQALRIVPQIEFFRYQISFKLVKD